uniref:RloB domain-containing protein n=1 Tax=Bordetella sputigena TaxID=1416810 RepID=UPI0039EE26BC
MPPRIAQRKRVFVGCEGESERSYVALLQKLLGQGAGYHLWAEVLNGGDPLAIVESAHKALRRDMVSGRAPFIGRFVILDDDLRGRNAQRDRLCVELAETLGLTLIWQVPCHEAILLRHLERCEHRRPPTSRESEDQLRAEWPGYVKNFGSDRLMQRINMQAIQRVSRHETGLAALFRMIALIT